MTISAKTFTAGLTFSDSTEGALIASDVSAYSGTVPLPSGYQFMVTALPAIGILKKADGSSVAVNSLMTEAEFLSMLFIPPSTYTGQTTFSYAIFNPGTSDMSNTGIVTLMIDTHIVTPEEQAAIDKTRMTRIVNDLQNGVQIPDDDSIFYTLGGSSAREKAVMAELDAGHGYQELKSLAAANTALGLTDTMIMRALSIFFTLTDTARYESERALQLITDYSILSEFATYLATNSVTPPDVKNAVSFFRSNQQAFAMAKTWSASRTV